MNGYLMMADSYRKLMNEGKLEKEKAEKTIRIYEFLATCDKEDLCEMVDSSAFNDIIRAFIYKAVNDVDIDNESRDKVISQLRYIFHEKNAAEVLKEYMM